ncbi:MAG: hypothetical protein IJ083_18005 [Clostridia bacterium]|nr:hypothetical protein [Clostridia bacterium]
MASIDYASKTVFELRRMAREMGLSLKPGLVKAEIISRIEAAAGMNGQDTQEAMAGESQEKPVEMPVKKTRGRKKAAEEPAPSMPDTEDAPAPEVKNSESGLPGAEHASDPAETKEPEGNTVPSLKEDPGYDMEDETAFQSADDHPIEIRPEFRRAPEGTTPGHPLDVQHTTAPHYKAAWQNQAPAIRGQSRSQYPDRSGGFGPAPYGKNASPAASSRPQNYTITRFGPDAGKPVEIPAPQSHSPWRESYPRSGRFGPQRDGDGTPQGGRSIERGGFDRPRSESSGGGWSAPGRREMDRRAEEHLPTREEILAATDLEEVTGYLEINQEGYGFLHNETMTLSPKDVFISISIIRRYQLRSGDEVTGKIRPPRENDRYPAMVYVLKINGHEVEGPLQRPYFDTLTPIYPKRRICLGQGMSDIRLMDLFVPMGFGQRCLMLMPPDCGKSKFLANLTSAVSEAHPDTEILTLLMEKAPEAVTNFRDHSRGMVLATNFEQSSEGQLRLMETMMERALRLAEEGKDVIVIIDSLNRVARAACGLNGVIRGSIMNPAGLMRIKKLLGCARNLREGGSVTLICVVDIESTSSLDEIAYHEIRDTINMIVTFDQALARKNIYPAIAVARSFCRQAAQLRSEQEREGMKILKEMLSDTDAEGALQQTMSLIDTVSTNEEITTKVKEWAQIMNPSKS